MPGLFSFVGTIATSIEAVIGRSVGTGRAAPDGSRVNQGRIDLGY